MIEELIGRGQQVDAVHFIYEVGLANRYPPVPLLKAFLRDAKKTAASVLDDPNNSGRVSFYFDYTFVLFSKSVVLTYSC